MRTAVPILLAWSGLVATVCRAGDGVLGPFDALISVADEVEVPARETGVLVELDVRDGERVDAGQLLGRVDDAAPRLAQGLAEKDLGIAQHQSANNLKVELARKALGVTEMELQRANNSNREHSNTVSQTEVDRLTFVRDKAALDIRQAEHDLREAELNVERAENALSLAKLAVERRALIAPIAGQVVEIKRHRGEWVEPGETVVRIVNTDMVRAEVLVKLADVPDDVKGRPVQVMLTAPGRQDQSFRGTVVFVDPRINAVNGEFRIWAEIENSAQLLRPGHRARLQILPAVSSSGDTP